MVVMHKLALTGGTVPAASAIVHVGLVSKNEVGVLAEEVTPRCSQCT